MDIQQQLTQLLTGNNLVTSGALLIVVQSIWANIKGVLESAFDYLKDRFIYKLTFSTSSAASYTALLRFLKAYGFLDGVRNVRTSQIDSTLFITEDAFNYKWLDNTLIFYSFKIRDLAQGETMYMRNERQSAMVTKEENFSLTYFGLSPQLRNRLEELINSFREEEIINKDTHFLLDVESTDFSSGQRVCAKRSLETIHLPAGQLEGIVKDIELFRASREKYLKVGINYKRIYLLEGVPGSGKTSLVKALASHFNTKLRVVESTDDLLTSGVCKEFAKNETFALIEEIDTIGAKNREEDSTEDGETKPGNPLINSFSNQKLKQLLTTLDGIQTPDGLVIFLTTNHVEKLDAALIRPGRVDYRLTFKAPDKTQIESACKYYLGDSWEPTYKRLVKAKPASMSAVQESLIQEYLNK